MQEHPATSVATRATRVMKLRTRARAVDVVVAALAVIVAAAWLPLLKLDWNMGLLVVPLLIIAAGAGVFFKSLVPQALVRSAFWGSFVCGTSISLVAQREPRGALVAVFAAAGLVLLSRVSRRARSHRPLGFFVVVLAVTDIAVHSLVCLFIHEVEVWQLFGTIAVANLIGLVAFAARGVRWPHIVANVVVVGVITLQLPDIHGWIVQVLYFVAGLQIVAMGATWLPAPGPRVQRFVGRLICAVIITLAVLAAAGSTC